MGSANGLSNMPARFSNGRVQRSRTATAVSTGMPSSPMSENHRWIVASVTDEVEVIDDNGRARRVKVVSCVEKGKNIKGFQHFSFAHHTATTREGEDYRDVTAAVSIGFRDFNDRVVVTRSGFGPRTNPKFYLVEMGEGDNIIVRKWKKTAPEEKVVVASVLKAAGFDVITFEEAD